MAMCLCDSAQARSAASSELKRFGSVLRVWGSEGRAAAS